MTTETHQATCRFCRLPVAVQIPVIESPATATLRKIARSAGSVACNRCYDYQTAQADRIDLIQRTASAIMRAGDESTASLRQGIKVALQAYARCAAEHFEIETEGMVNRWHGDILNDPYAARVTMQHIGRELRTMCDEKHLY